MAKKIIALIIVGVMVALGIYFVIVSYDKWFSNENDNTQIELPSDNADENKITLDYEIIYF